MCRTFFVALLLFSTLAIPSRSEEVASGRSSVAAAGSWKTWAISSGQELRLGPPPDSQATLAEIGELRKLVDERAADHDRIAFWDAGPPSYRWVEVAVDRIEAGPLKGLNAARQIALVNVAIYDATVAAWDSKYTYNRPRPSAVDPSLTTAIAVPATPSYPDEHAATAAAAAYVLSYLFPNDRVRFLQMAAEDAQSRVIAGIAYPSDAKAGHELGAAVAEKVIEGAKNDGFDKQWTGVVPVGPGFWNGTGPVMPLAGTWRTWVLAPADRFRPGPPQAYNSPEKQAELAEIKNFKRTFDTNATAFHYQTADGIFGDWYSLASLWMMEDRLDSDAPRAALIYAAMSMAHNDSMVACWDAKYTYWAIRPFQLDSDVKTLFATPNHPSYPAAHGCGSAAIAAVMGHFFPTRSDYINGKADAAAWSRLAAGIHYRSDIEAGLRLGRSVGGVVVNAVESPVKSP
jgi:membrane-associated phospholipid phosphatase